MLPTGGKAPAWVEWWLVAQEGPIQHQPVVLQPSLRVRRLGVISSLIAHLVAFWRKINFSSVRNTEYLCCQKPHCQISPLPWEAKLSGFHFYFFLSVCNFASSDSPGTCTEIRRIGIQQSKQRTVFGVAHSYFRRTSKIHKMVVRQGFNNGAKKGFSEPPIVQVLLLKKITEVCHFHHRYTPTVRERMWGKKLQEITL